ncbi:hypothetical protein EDC01DRAFT_630593 [Geopyxis carbonaria]|nr:hypothetical protein EDC01DRAFT_630593 [Geopyxis carbonaria]
MSSPTKENIFYRYPAMASPKKESLPHPDPPMSSPKKFAPIKLLHVRQGSKSHPKPPLLVVRDPVDELSEMFTTFAVEPAAPAVIPYRNTRLQFLARAVLVLVVLLAVAYLYWRNIMEDEDRAAVLQAGRVWWASVRESRAAVVESGAATQHTGIKGSVLDTGNSTAYGNGTTGYGNGNSTGYVNATTGHGNETRGYDNGTMCIKGERAG